MTEFGDRMQRRTFKPKKKKVIGLLQKNVCNEVLYHFTLHKILGTKLRVAVRWTAHVSCLEKIRRYKILLLQSEG